MNIRREYYLRQDYNRSQEGALRRAVLSPFYGRAGTLACVLFGIFSCCLYVGPIATSIASPEVATTSSRAPKRCIEDHSYVVFRLVQRGSEFPTVAVSAQAGLHVAPPRVTDGGIYCPRLFDLAEMYPGSDYAFLTPYGSNFQLEIELHPEGRGWWRYPIKLDYRHIPALHTRRDRVYLVEISVEGQQAAARVTEMSMADYLQSAQGRRIQGIGPHLDE